MELASDPAFQRKTRIFLQVRSLLLLQKEEVNDKVKVSDAEMRAKYQELYTPLWLLQRLEFKDEAAAKAAGQQLADGTVTIDELLKRSVAEGPVATREDWRRPSGVDPEWAKTFRQLAVGQTTAPVPFDDLFVIYRLKEQEAAATRILPSCAAGSRTNSGRSRKWSLNQDADRPAAPQIRGESR